MKLPHPFRAIKRRRLAREAATRQKETERRDIERTDAAALSRGIGMISKLGDSGYRLK